MEPWNGYTLDDPRAQPANWLLGDDNQWFYVGPAVTPTGEYGPPPQPAYDPLSSAYQPAPPPAGYATTPAGDNFTYTPPPAAPASGGYATTPVGDNFTVDAQRFAEYEAYLNGQGFTASPPPSAGATTAATNPALSTATPAYPGTSAPAGGGNAYGSGGGYTGGGYPYPTIPGMPQETASPRQFGMPFDPFAWSGTTNPMPSSGPMRSQILNAMGQSGPVWAPAGPAPKPSPAAPTMPAPIQMGPTPAEQRQTILDAMEIGQQIAEANQGPKVWPALDYVAAKLKLNDPGSPY